MVGIKSVPESSEARGMAGLEHAADVHGEMALRGTGGREGWHGRG